MSGLADALRRAGWTVWARPCGNATIRQVRVGDVVAKEVRCDCGYQGFNAAGMDEEYEWHRARSHA